MHDDDDDIQLKVHDDDDVMCAGAAPFMLSERAMEKMMKRKSAPHTYNLDMKLIGDYWGWWNKRSYHHTGEEQ